MGFQVEVFGVEAVGVEDSEGGEEDRELRDGGKASAWASRGVKSIVQTHLGLELVEPSRLDRILSHLIPLQPKVHDALLLRELLQPKPALEPTIPDIQDLQPALTRISLSPGTEMRGKGREGSVVVEAEFVEVREGGEIRQSGGGELVVRC